MNHISYSQISTYLKCGEKYRRNYIEMEKLPPNAAMVVGSSIHYGVEIANKTIIDGGDTLDTETVINLALSYWEQNKGDIGYREHEIDSFYDDLKTFWKKKEKAFDSEHKKALKQMEKENKTDPSLEHMLKEKTERYQQFMEKEKAQYDSHIDNLNEEGIVDLIETEAKNKVIRLTKAYHEHYQGKMSPFKSEMPFEVKLHEYFPPIRGIIDLIDHDKKTNTYNIIDIKTSSKTPAIDDIIYDLQMSIYDIAVRKMFNVSTILTKRWIVDTKETKVVEQTTKQRSSEQIERVIRRIEKVMEYIAKEVFLPAPQGCWWCGERWCDYWDDCQVRP